MDSPLLFPVKLKGNVIIVLDETLLPNQEEYIEVAGLDRAIWVLKEMKTRSLGQVLLFFYCCVLFKEKYTPDVIAKLFKEQRPTFDFFMLAQIINSQAKQGAAIEIVVNKFIERFDWMRRERASKLAKILPSPANILTICNVNGELIYLYQELMKLNKPTCFFVCETRPYLQGTRQTFWELEKNNIPVKLLCDNQAAYLMKEKKVNCVVTGADRATINGDIINKLGTYALACLAKYFFIPFYPLTQYPRDINVDSIEIEERPMQEVFMFLDGDFSGYDAFYPAFDVTRANLVTQAMELK